MEVPRISGSISLQNRIAGDLSGTGSISGKVEILPSPGVTVYTGPTEVDPEFESVVLETARKLVPFDITVNPIQVESVSNPYGGRTVYIGGII